MCGLPESGTITTTERNESCALIEGENHRETPEHTDIPISGFDIVKTVQDHVRFPILILYFLFVIVKFSLYS